MLISQILTAALLAAMSATHDTIPTDPFQKCARKAIRGEFGHLAGWQRTGYKRGLSQGVTCSRTLVLTTYYPGEGRDGQVDCRGNKCRPGTLASNRLPHGTVVFIPWTQRLSRVADRGARSNDQRAARRGGVWVDVWLRHPREARGRADWTPTRGAVVRP